MAKTYYHRSTSTPTGIHVANHEQQQILDTPGASAVELIAPLDSGTSVLSHVFTTDSGEPNVADWPNGTYRCILDVTTAGVDISYGVRLAGTANGHFARVNSGLTADSETRTQTESLFTGTGAKVATTAWDPAAGNATDRFECLVGATRAVSHGNQSLGITVSDPTASVANGGVSDGPWGAAAPSAPGSGRIHVRGTAAGTKIGIGAASGRAHIRASAVGFKIASAPATSRIHVRSTAVGAEVSAAQSAPAQGRVHLRGTAAGFKVASGQATGRVHLRGTASGLKIGLGAATGRLHIRGTATGAEVGAVPSAPAFGRVHVRSTATGFKIGLGSAQGRTHVRGIASGFKVASGSAIGRLHVRGTGAGLKIALGAAHGRTHVRGTAVGVELGALQSAAAVGRIRLRAMAAGGVSLVFITEGDGSQSLGLEGDGSVAMALEGS